jgi:PhoD-like phosphatase
MAHVVLGPLLRYIAEREATVWVETDVACDVAVLGRKQRTFRVGTHHYALVCIEGLEPGSDQEYGVDLDGERAWPLPNDPFPPPRIRTLDAAETIRLSFGSCRVATRHHHPYSLKKDDSSLGREIDALYALAMRMRDEPRSDWPHLLALLGDQVYADETSPGTHEFIRSRRDPEQPPGLEVADFEEYCRLYYDSWQDAGIRWLFSTVATAMIFDDHDVHDDWNTSGTWIREYRAKPWWDERIVGAFTSYWLYQHIGNLSPRELDDDALYREVRDSGRDNEPRLEEFAFKADRETEGTRWSFRRDIGGTRLVMMDSRAGRDVEDDRHRSMLDEKEWHWLDEQLTGDVDHLLLGTSLPVLLAPGMYHLEAWNEALCAGAWGGLAARLGEKLRQGLDLEHWSAFQESFRRLVGIVREVGTGRRGTPPASIVALSGDVHHAYVAEVAWPRGTGMRAPFFQAVCSPFRNPLDSRERKAILAAASRPAEAVARLLARAARVPDPPIRWRLRERPVFDNQVATLEIRGRELRLRIDRAIPADAHVPTLECVSEQRLA